MPVQDSLTALPLRTPQCSIACTLRDADLPCFAAAWDWRLSAGDHDLVMLVYLQATWYALPLQ